MSRTETITLSDNTTLTVYEDGHLFLKIDEPNVEFKFHDTDYADDWNTAKENVLNNRPFYMGRGGNSSSSIGYKEKTLTFQAEVSGCGGDSDCVVSVIVGDDLMLDIINTVLRVFNFEE